MKLKIATRNSKLALWQADFVAQKLQKAGFQTEIVPIITKGDRVLDRSLAKIGSKGVFTEELEEKLLQGEVHLAVHSAKDLPSVLHKNLEIIAYTEREPAHDVLVSFKRNISLKGTITIGTASTRRVAILKHFYPQAQVVEVRGNLQTRLQKLESGLCDALILAYAGIKRMNYNWLIVEHLPIEIFTPTAGQGSIAVEANRQLNQNLRERIQQAVNHLPTAICVQAERAFLKTLQGGCSVPVFVLAQWQEHAIHLQGGVVSWDGQEYICSKVSAHPHAIEQEAVKAAQEVLQKGGSRILSQKPH